MSTTSRLGAAVLAVSITLGGAAMTVPAGAHSTGIHDNCTNLNKKWPHGVGRKGAHDKASGKPVTNFYRNTKQYNLAVSHNGTLDRDGDKIACEKA
jgi:hypothetical protein